MKKIGIVSEKMYRNTLTELLMYKNLEIMGEEAFYEVLIFIQLLVLVFRLLAYLSITFFTFRSFVHKKDRAFSELKPLIRSQNIDYLSDSHTLRPSCRYDLYKS